MRATVPVLFTAHSLPERIVAMNDPYPDEVKGTVEAVTAASGQPDRPALPIKARDDRENRGWDRPWNRCWKIWLATDTGMCWWRRSAFICDHVETLFDIDIELKQLAVESRPPPRTHRHAERLSAALIETLGRRLGCTRILPLSFSRDAPRTVVIVGGGISGLATAFSLHEQAAARPVSRSAVPCSKPDPSWGGKIVTHRVGELVTEAGPDSFLSQKPAGLDLCAKLGLTDQLINTNETGKKACVYIAWPSA